MMRVMHVLAPGPTGGLERVVQALAVAQRRSMHVADVHVVTIGTAPVRAIAAFLAPLRKAGVQIHTLVTPVRAYARQRQELLACVENLQPDVVHSHGAHADVLASNIGESTGAATVTTMHGVTGGDLRNRAYEWLQRKSCRRRDAVVSVSRALANALLQEGFAPERMHVVRNAWSPAATTYSRAEARRMLGLPAVGYVAGWVGRLSREKGLDLLLKALALPPTLDLHLSVIGDGRQRRSLQRRGARTPLGRDKRIFWHGLQPNAAGLLPAFDVLVMSSRSEGTPMLLFEAMAAGVPIVTTAVGGIVDVIGPEEAMLVPPRNPRALAAAVAQVQRDPTAARQRAQAAARRLLLEHNVLHWVDRYSSVYDAALAAAALRRPDVPRPRRFTARRVVPASPEPSLP